MNIYTTKSVKSNKSFGGIASVVFEAFFCISGRQGCRKKHSIKYHIGRKFESLLYWNDRRRRAMNKVLFVCIHNSARSQMAEAYLNKFAEGRATAESAGLEPGRLNPLVVKAMAEDGIDISGNKTKSVFDLFGEGRLFSYIVAVCDAEAAERCPVFPGTEKKLHWPFKDPSRAEGSEEDKLIQIRAIRDEIKKKVKEFLETM